MDKMVHVVSVSGGKDSTATILLALEKHPRESLRFCFADTGNEHEAVYEYLDYLENRLDITIERLKVNFDARIAASGEGSSRISIDVPESEIAQVTRLFLYSNAAFKLTIEEWSDDDVPAVQEEAPHIEHQANPDSLAKKMHVKGYFFNPNLWAAMEAADIYTQAEHKRCLETLPCIARHHGNEVYLSFCKRLDVPGPIKTAPCASVDAEKIICAHHCRSSANAGTGFKPPDWYAVPVCDAHHKLIHSKETTQAFNQALVEYSAGLTAYAIKTAMKNVIGIDSLSLLTRDMLDQFHKGIGFSGMAL